MKSPVKTLVYFVAVGDDVYFEQAYAAIYTLRRYGGYEGDVAVITDRPEKVTWDVKVFDVRPVAPRKEDTPATAYGMNCKALLNRFLHPEMYSFVLFLDTDILVTSARFTPLLYAMAQIGGLWIHQNYWVPVHPNGPRNMGGGHDPSLFVKCPNLSVCAGIVGFGADAYGSLEHWRRLCIREDMKTDDQGSLHVVAAAFNDGRVHYLPTSDIWFPTNRVLNPCLYHFTHMEKDLMRSMTRELVSKNP